jgi:hypothetical protein
MNNILLPLGIDLFEELRTTGYYYIDKTKFIRELLQDHFKVNLITRPRRFGKTLTMSMLANFFDIRKNSKKIFKGLAISEDRQLCEKWMNQFPVIFITLKDIEDLNFTDAFERLKFVISRLCIEHSYLLDSERVTKSDKKLLTQLIDQEASKSTIINSLLLLTQMLQSHFGKPVILLIDEYDVPLAKAYEHGYYEQMLNIIRGILSNSLSNSLKTNPCLQFAVITGCLRISKESIFTGTNHFVSNSILSKRYQDIFGFTKEEVTKLLADTELENHHSDMKQWYDGYRIDNTELYCPWDVLNYVSDLKIDETSLPGNYWKDTSHNDIIRSFIGQKNFNVTEKFETLLSGGSIKVKLCDTLTYDLLHSSEENFWSILYLTGYLTTVKTTEILSRNETYLKIPNEEVKTIFEETVVEWFKDNVAETNRKPLMDALWKGKDEKASSILTDLLFQTISYHNYKEDYYHAFLSGIFVGLGYATESDKEHGEGRPDLVVKDIKNRRVLIIEAKHSKEKIAMEEDCKTAVNQILVRKYAYDFLDGYKEILCYGVAFFKKQCLIKRIELF